jgi:hypothetical protein
MIQKNTDQMELGKGISIIYFGLCGLFLFMGSGIFKSVNYIYLGIAFLMFILGMISFVTSHKITYSRILAVISLLSMFFTGVSIGLLN